MDPQLSPYKQKMIKAIEALKFDLATLRTGRASASLVENLEVLVYGGSTRMKIIELASITTPDSHLLVISPWDRSVVGEIAKGIQLAKIGLNPVLDSDVIRISIPPLTEERRMELVRSMHQKLEGGKVMVRQIRHDAMGEIKRGFEESIIAEDDKDRMEKELQNLTDEMMAEIDSIGETKEKELMTV